MLDKQQYYFIVNAIFQLQIVLERLVWMKITEKGNKKATTNIR